MKREIKFRGKCIDTNKWIYGGFHTDGERCIIIHKQGINLSQMTEVHPESVGQFTGLRDKNDIEIYEGDDVKWFDEDIYPEGKEVICPVKFLYNDTLGWDFGKLRKLTGDKLWISLIPESMESV